MTNRTFEGTPDPATLFLHAPAAMVVTLVDGTIVLATDSVADLFGRSRDPLVGTSLRALLEVDALPAHPSQMVLEVRGRHADGGELTVEVSSSASTHGGAELTTWVCRDVTRHPRAEDRRGDLAAIVEASDDAIISKTLAGVILTWNRGATDLFGYSAEEMVGQSIARLLPEARSEEEPTILQAAADGKVQRFDTVRRRKDGVEVDVSVTISPIRDARGRVVAVCKIARDITARKKAEAELARAKELAEAASQELRSFSYSVAHDLRAPLRGIDGFAQALLEDYAGAFDAAGADYLNEIRSNAQRMGALIDALLSLAQVTRSELRQTDLDLSHLFADAAAECARLEPERKVEVVVAEGLVAQGDHHLVRTLFGNLVGNAYKFTRGVAAARIELAMVERDGKRQVVVRDNGAGFDMAYAAKLFQPFQRLHTLSEFPGTGIGLATVQRIVHRHGGSIRAEGQVGHGASIFFSLPHLAKSGGSP